MDKFKEDSDDNHLMGDGSNFRVIDKDSEGKPTYLLDWSFNKKALSAPHPSNDNKRPGDASMAVIRAESTGSREQTSPKEDSDDGIASVPFKTKAGPLSISNILPKWVGKVLRTSFNAT